MQKVETAREVMRSAVRRLASQTVSLSQCAGRFLAEPLVALAPVPAFDCSAMDGWAVRATEAVTGARLRFGGRLLAGDAPGAALGPGEAVRIFTGAPIPSGADAVVPQELAEETDAGVVLRQGAQREEHIRRAGEDLKIGEVALAAGTRLGPRQLGLCAALRAAALPVVVRPRAVVLATGDEIARGIIPDSNGAAMALALERIGCLVTPGVVGDDLGAIAQALQLATAQADLVFTTGGVSVGEKDLVPRALEQIGARIVVQGVAMKPGKPLVFALAGGRPIIGLPGSPSACLVAFEVFGRPFALALAGAARVDRRMLRLPLVEALEGRPGRVRCVWASLTDDGRARPLGRDVAQIHGPALADLMLFLPEDAGALASGDLVEAWLLDEAVP